MYIFKWQFMVAPALTARRFWVQFLLPLLPKLSLAVTVLATVMVPVVDCWSSPGCIPPSYLAVA